MRYLFLIFVVYVNFSINKRLRENFGLLFQVQIPICIEMASCIHVQLFRSEIFCAIFNQICRHGFQSVSATSNCVQTLANIRTCPFQIVGVIKGQMYCG